MINNIVNGFKSLDKVAKIVMKKGLVFCLFIALIAIIFLFIYLFNNTSILFTVGLSLFRSSLIFAIEFIICGFVVDKIKKQLI